MSILTQAEESEKQNYLDAAKVARRKLHLLHGLSTQRYILDHGQERLLHVVRYLEGKAEHIIRLAQREVQDGMR